MANTPLHLTWQTIQNTIQQTHLRLSHASDNSIVQGKSSIVEQLEKLLKDKHRAQQSNMTDTSLMSHQLTLAEQIDVALILIKNGRTQVLHSTDPLQSLINIFGQDQLQALEILYRSGVFGYGEQLSIMHDNNELTDPFQYNLILSSQRPIETASKYINMLNNNSFFNHQDKHLFNEELISNKQGELINHLANNTDLLSTGDAADNFHVIGSHPDPFALSEAIYLARKIGFFQGNMTQKDFKLLAEHTMPKDLVNGLNILHEQKLSRQQHNESDSDELPIRDKVHTLAHIFQKPYQSEKSLAEVAKENFRNFNTKKLPKSLNTLVRLHKSGLLDGEMAYDNLLTVISDPFEYRGAINVLDTSFLNNDNAQYYFNILHNENAEPYNMAEALNNFYKFGLLQSSYKDYYLDKLTEHEHPNDIDLVLQEVYQAGLLKNGEEQSRTIFDRIINHPKINNLPENISEINRDCHQHLDKQQLLEFFLSHNKPEATQGCLYELNEADLNSSNNVATIANIEDRVGACYALHHLRGAQLLTQANFDALTHEDHQTLIDRDWWESIPPYRLTQEVFNDLLQCARQPQPQDVIEQYIDFLIENTPEQARQYLNNQQSTHTASVHRTVSQSAQKLYNRYCQNMTRNEFQTIWSNITQWLYELNRQNHTDDTVQAALKAWHRYQDHRFIEQGSGVSMRQIIVCFWQAIHDPENTMLENTEDGKRHLRMALYDNQRGDNQNAQGVDQGGRDLPICTAGQFNKFVERLQGVHPDAQVIFITEASASKKLPVVVKDIIQESNLEQQVIQQQALDDDTWQKIRDEVIERMAEEFVVETGLTRQTLENIVDNSGPYLGPDNMGLNQSTGNSQAHNMTQHGLFSHASDQTPANQDQYNNDTNQDHTANNNPQRR